MTGSHRGCLLMGGQRSRFIQLGVGGVVKAIDVVGAYRGGGGQSGRRRRLQLRCRHGSGRGPGLAASFAPGSGEQKYSRS